MKRVRRSIRHVFGVAAVAVSGGLVAACGAGGGNVYVGVGVMGPYGGYPGYYYPPRTMIGRPPVYWEEEEEDVDSTNAQVQEYDAEPHGTLHGAEGSF
jgi:hypothetical protein